MTNTSRHYPWFRIAQGTIVLFAVLFVWVVGHRGVFLLDQSILFDGAWRIFQGQVPYRDFYSTFPPAAFVLQAIFFSIAGVDFSAMVLSAAVLNGAAAACVIWIVRRLEPAQPVLALIAGLITAFWFTAPLGTLFFEQTAFFFNLLAVVFLVKAIDTSNASANGLRFGAGALLAFSMLSKQNAGAEFIPVALGIAAWPCFPSWRKTTAAILRTLMGFATVFGCFLLWVWQFSSLSKFWLYYVMMLRQIGEDRIHPLRTAIYMLTLFPTIVYVAPVVLALCIALTLRRQAPSDNDRHTLKTWILLGCVVYQNLFKVHTDNEVENAVPFLGLVYGLAFGLLLETSSRWGILKEGAERNRARANAYLLVSLVVLAFPIVSGAQYSWGRSANEFEKGTRFTNSLNVSGMSRVKWGEPTIIEPHDSTRLSQQEFESLNRRLDELDSNFFVFVDSTVLYGMHKRVSPQPWLYFSEGHSFRREDLPRMDAAVVDSLTKNNVKVVVLEKRSWLGNEKILNDLPVLREWIHRNFQRDTSFGIFEIWVQHPQLSTR